MQQIAISHDQLTYSPKRGQMDSEALVIAHSQLVRRIAWHVYSSVSTAVEIEDLIQIGMIALVEGARTFEDRGISFVPYATMRVRGAMVDQLRRDARMFRSGMANARKVAATRLELESKLGRTASDREMSESLGLDANTYHALVASTIAARQDSIDEVYSDHDMWFADMSDDAETLLERKQLHTALAQNISRLPEREATILQLYFAEELNLDEIGETLSIGAARVCQIKKAALERLRGMMSEH